VRERIQAMDVLRGVAIFGIFVVNWPYFALPSQAAQHNSLAGMSFFDQMASVVNRGLFEYKFVSLFSMLFGMGMIVQMLRMEARGRAFVPLYARRLGILIAMGLIHALGLWFGDILFLYGIAGFLLLLVRRFSVRQFLTTAAVFFAVAFVVSGTVSGLFLVLDADRQTRLAEAATEVAVAPIESDAPVVGDETIPPEIDPGSTTGSGMAPPPDPMTEEEPTADGMADADADPAPDPNVDDRMERILEAMRAAGEDEEAWSRAEFIAYSEGPLLGAFMMRSITWLIVQVVAFFVFNWRVLMMFALGAGLMKWGFFERRRIPTVARLCAVALPMGLALEAFATWGRFTDVGWHLKFAASYAHEVGATALALGYASAVTLIVHAGILDWLARQVACVGRMALTNYIGQTVIATGITYWWGLGMYGQFSAGEMLLLAIGIYVGQVVISSLYLRLFSMGPLEYLWRWATYGRRPPLRATRSAHPMSDK
jgi:uncharacterized protein